MNKKEYSFDALPLDINIAKMQFNILRYVEKEILNEENFKSITESYKNKDARVGIDEIKISCKYSDTSTYEVIVAICAVSSKIHCEQKLFCGTKEELMKYLKDSDKQFFSKVKELALGVSEQSKTL